MGTVAQRPWAATLAELGVGGKSGQLTLRARERTYRIAFSHGIVVGATSPLAADSVSRIALAHGMITPAKAQAILRTLGRIAVDDVERFAEASELPGPSVHALKRRVIIQRTARTFEVEDGEYTIEDRIAIPVLVGVEVDVRAAIAFGARKYQSTERLVADLRALGTRFALRPDAEPDLARFELGDAAGPVLDALRSGTSVPELEATHRHLDPRLVISVLVSLAASGALAPFELAGRAQDVSLPRAPTPRRPTTTEGPAYDSARLAIPVELTSHPEPTMTRVPTPRQPTTTAPTNPHVIKRRPRTPPRGTPYRAYTDPFLEAQPTAALSPPLSIKGIRKLIASRASLLGKGVDHFEFLGVSYDATIAEVRAAYVELARYLRPERLAELGYKDEHHDARTVFAQVLIAYTVLTDPDRRADYMRLLGKRRM
jgi:hypothetical protein